MSKMGAIKIAWLSVALLIVVPLVVTYNPTAHRDNDVVLVYVLLALTFPSGVLLLPRSMGSSDTLFKRYCPRNCRLAASR